MSTVSNIAQAQNRDNTQAAERQFYAEVLCRRVVQLRDIADHGEISSRHASLINQAIADIEGAAMWIKGGA